MLPRRLAHLRLSNEQDRPISRHHHLGGINLYELLAFLVLRKAYPRFRQFDGKRPVVGMVQLYRKAVAFLPPSSEFLASSHYSGPRHTPPQRGNAGEANRFHTQLFRS
jgi:hypothetical protein